MDYKQALEKILDIWANWQIENPYKPVIQMAEEMAGVACDSLHNCQPVKLMIIMQL